MKKVSSMECLDNPAYNYKITLEAGELVSWKDLLKAFIGLLKARGYTWNSDITETFEDLTELDTSVGVK